MTWPGVFIFSTISMVFVQNGMKLYKESREHTLNLLQFPSQLPQDHHSLRYYLIRKESSTDMQQKGFFLN